MKAYSCKRICIINCKVRYLQFLIKFQQKSLDLKMFLYHHFSSFLKLLACLASSALWIFFISFTFDCTQAILQ